MKKLKLLMIIILVPISLYSATWQRCPAFTNQNIQAVHFLNKATGWVVTNNEVWLSTDSGFSWTNKNVSIDSGACFTSWFLLDEKHAWIESSQCAQSKSVLFSTTDGGITWVKDTGVVGVTQNGLFFIDELHGWRCHGPIDKTEDGGKSWKFQFASPLETGEFTSVRFLDSKVGFATGTEDSDFTKLSPETVIYRTDDGGLNWVMVCKPEPIDNRPVPLLTDIIAVDSTTVLFLGTAQFRHDLYVEMPTIITTVDQGKTWDVRELFPEETYPVGIYHYCWSFSFSSANEGYIVLESSFADGSVMATTDGGKTWTMSFKAPERLNTIQVIDAEHGWCGGEKGSFYLLTRRTVSSRTPRPLLLRSVDEHVASHRYLLNGQKMGRYRGAHQANIDGKSREVVIDNKSSRRKQ